MKFADSLNFKQVVQPTVFMRFLDVICSATWQIAYENMATDIETDIDTDNDDNDNDNDTDADTDNDSDTDSDNENDNDNDKLW